MAPVTNTATAAIISLGMLVPLSHWGSYPAVETLTLPSQIVAPLCTLSDVDNLTIQWTTQTMPTDYRNRDDSTCPTPADAAAPVEPVDAESWEIVQNAYGNACFGLICCSMVEMVCLIACCKSRFGRHCEQNVLGTTPGEADSEEVKTMDIQNETTQYPTRDCATLDPSLLDDGPCQQQKDLRGRQADTEACNLRLL
eukprot:TRINITY_DN20036_c0_g1_i1.p1 TRINITY_DN20036_c0_g1~~TRINITY_DN20036_c0_g1_i1.p1  ORF type:complete len:220 (-),score=27.02 TRINITY_DN20036_c0_g1_i1:287-877(-)